MDRSTRTRRLVALASLALMGVTAPLGVHATDVTLEQLLQSGEVTTEDAKLNVKLGRGATLPAGQHTFELVVTDDSGNQSAPARVKIIVQDTTPPTAVLKAPAKIGVGESFELDGSKSKDAPPGKIIRYEWRKVE